MLLVSLPSRRVLGSEHRIRGPHPRHARQDAIDTRHGKGCDGPQDEEAREDNKRPKQVERSRSTKHLVESQSEEANGRQDEDET
jgi:hypothetical protein